MEVKKKVIGQGPDGADIEIFQYILKGNHPGPIIHVQANIHGAELQGNQVIAQLIDYFSHHSFHGEIRFVPAANPIALRNKIGTSTQGRYNSITGENWNRSYQDFKNLPQEKSGFSIDEFAHRVQGYKKQEIITDFKKSLKESLIHYRDYLERSYSLKADKALHLELQIMAADADIVLDLHTGPIATDYIYAGIYQKEDASHLGFPFTLLIPNQFAGAMDEACFMPWRILDESLKKRGKNFELAINAYTVELGSEEVISQEKGRIQTNRLLNYLNFKGMKLDLLNYPCLKTEQIYTKLENFYSLHAPYGGLFEYIKKPGDIFKKGEILGRYLFTHKPGDSFEVKAQGDGYIISHCPSSAVYSGMTLFQLLSSPSLF